MFLAQLSQIINSLRVVIMPTNRYCIILTLICIYSVLTESANPVVRVSQGVLSGSWQVSSNGRTYASFRGIPYARPPVGKYRFREPQQLKPWAGVWDATRFGTTCLQYDPFNNATIGSENCLFVNVYTPQLNAGASLPVLIFIHGGAFMYGGSNVYDPVHIMDRDFVAVTFNYRLGPLGFLSTGDELGPGNMGLKDQSFALHWVKNNIMMFGGNPDSITLTGCSAGGASVHYHYLSPLSKGTFNRGIAFSGSAFASWTNAMRPAQKARNLASRIGCPITTTRELLDCLRHRPAESIVQAQIDMFDWRVHMFTMFTPTVEPANVRDPFLTQYPYFAMQSDMAHKLPLIVTVTSDEGLYPAAAYLSEPDILYELESRWEQLASNIFEFNDTLPVQQRAGVANKIKQRYLGGKPVSKETFPQLVQALGDRLFVVDVGKLAQSHAVRSGQAVYVYRYAFRGEKSLSNLMARDNEIYGTSHADDVFHIWQFAGIELSNAADKQMIEMLLDLLYAYATTGIPSVPGNEWNPVVPGSQEINYLEITAPGKAQMKISSDFGHKSFWDSLGFLENERAQFNVRDEL